MTHEIWIWFVANVTPEMFAWLVLGFLAFNFVVLPIFRLHNSFGRARRKAQKRNVHVSKLPDMTEDMNMSQDEIERMIQEAELHGISPRGRR